MKRLQLTKRQKMVVGIAIGLLLVAGITLVVYSGQRAWSGLANTTAHQRAELERDGKTLSRKMSVSERRAAVTRLADYDQEAWSCKGGWWYAWQVGKIQSATEARDRCRKEADAIRDIRSSSRELSQYLTHEEQISNIIMSLKIDSSKPDWQQVARQSANTAKDTLAKLELSIPAASKVQSVARTNIDSIVAAWNTLETAENEQNRTKYTDSIAALKQAYAELAEINDMAESELAVLANKLAKTLRG